MPDPLTVTVTRADHDRIIAALTVAANAEPAAFRPTLARVYEWAGETIPPDYAHGDWVEVCTDNGDWIPAEVLDVGESVRVAYQHDAPSGPYVNTLPRDAIRRPVATH